MPPKASEPASGSVIAQAPIFSRSPVPGSQRSFWASVPRDMIVAAPRPRLTPTVLSKPMLTPASSDTSTAAIDACAPSPQSRPMAASGFLVFLLARSLSSIVLTASAARIEAELAEQLARDRVGRHLAGFQSVEIRPDLFVDESADGVAHDQVGVGPFEHDLLR